MPSHLSVYAELGYFHIEVQIFVIEPKSNNNFYFLQICPIFMLLKQQEMLLA